MYPSLCILDAKNYQFSEKSEELLKSNLNTEEYAIITNTDDSKPLKIKFKLIELFENI